MEFEEKNSWFLDLKSSDKVLFYQPKILPQESLLIIQKVLESFAIDAVYYSKISISSASMLFDYHLIGLEWKSIADSKKLILELDAYCNDLVDFKFVNLGNDKVLSDHLRKAKLVYKR